MKIISLFVLLFVLLIETKSSNEILNSICLNFANTTKNLTALYENISDSASLQCQCHMLSSIQELHSIVISHIKNKYDKEFININNSCQIEQLDELKNESKQSLREFKLISMNQDLTQIVLENTKIIKSLLKKLDENESKIEKYKLELNSLQDNVEKKDICDNVSEFKCDSSLCISITQLCDGYDDCMDKSDESNCSPSETIDDFTVNNITDVCDKDTCKNGGTCKSNKSEEFKCDCLLGYTGNECENAIKIEIAGHFKGDGYIELDRNAILNGTTEKVNGVAVLFSTSHSDGLLVWHGQNKGENYTGQDFIAIAIVNGTLQYSFRVNGEESFINNTSIRVNDGFRHVAIIKLESNRASLELDFYTLFENINLLGKKEVSLQGNLFIGGAPDLGNFTGNRYTNGFSGCVHIVESLNGGLINLSEKAISAINVDHCPIEDDDE